MPVMDSSRSSIRNWMSVYGLETLARQASAAICTVVLRWSKKDKKVDRIEISMLRASLMLCMVVLMSLVAES